MEYYPKIFQKIDTDGDGQVPSGECGQWLQNVILQLKSDPAIAQPLFAVLWQLSTGTPLEQTNPTAPVQGPHFFNMMRCVACIQQGATAETLVQLASAHTGTPLPTFGPITYETLCGGDGAAAAEQPQQPQQPERPQPVATASRTQTCFVRLVALLLTIIYS